MGTGDIDRSFATAALSNTIVSKDRQIAALREENARLTQALAGARNEALEAAAKLLDEGAQLRRDTAKEKDYDPDHTIAIKVAQELEFVAASIRAL